MFEMRYFRLAAILLGTLALCQTPRAGSSGKVTASISEAQQIADLARGFAPEYAADILIRLLDLNGAITDRKQRLAALEDIYSIAGAAEHPFPLAYVGPVEAWQGAREPQICRLDRALDTLSLRCAAVIRMSQVDPARARELLVTIRTPPAKTESCERVLVETSDIFYRTTLSVALSSFSLAEKKKGLHVELIASTLRRIESARDIGSAVKLLTASGLTDDEFRSLFPLFCDRVSHAAYGLCPSTPFWDSFLVIDEQMPALLARARAQGNGTEELLTAYRHYLVHRFGADRCSDRGYREIDLAFLPDFIEHFNEELRLSSSEVPELYRKDLTQFSVRTDRAKFELAPDLAGPEQIRRDISQLIFGSGSKFNEQGLSKEDREDSAWQTDADRALERIQTWQADLAARTPACFHVKCSLYSELLDACPPGALRAKVLAAYVGFLTDHQIEKDHPIEWLTQLYVLLDPGHQLTPEERARVLAAWSSSRDSIIAAYARLEKYVALAKGK